MARFTPTAASPRWATSCALGLALAASLAMPAAAQPALITATPPVHTVTVPKPPEQVSGLTMSTPSAAMAGNGVLHLSATALNNAINIRSKKQQWGDWISLGGTVIGAPSLVGHPSGRIDVFVRAANNQLFQRTFDQSVWGSYVSMGGTLGGSPAAASHGENLLGVVAPGADGRVYSRIWDGKTWSPFLKVSDTLIVGSPALMSPTPGVLHLYARTISNSVVFASWKGGVWSSLTAVPGLTTFDDVSAVALGAGASAVITTNAAHEPQLNTRSAAQSSPVPLLTGPVVGAVAAVHRGQGVLEVFYRRADNQLYQITITL